MVPSPKALEAALIEGTYHIFTSDPDATSVNKVRKHVEGQQGLEEGFFSSDDWRHKSKNLIKEHVDKLLDGRVPAQEDSPSRNEAKTNASQDTSPPPPKRQKQGSKRGKDGAKPKGQEDDIAKTKAQPSKTASRRKSQVAQPDLEPGVKKQNSPSHDVEDDASSSIKVDTPKPSAGEESEEYSDVIDEGPKPKRKKKESKHESSKPTKSSKPSKPPPAKKPTATTTDDPQEAEIKKLQSQLVKCGVRKLWHNELKQYKDDRRAKIRHLKKMLADTGMDGRFSEAKAREIKETRELMADVDAAQEMNALWGMHSGRRAARSKQKSLEVDDSEGSDVAAAAAKNTDRKGKGDDEDDGDDDNQQATSFVARRRRAQADLAFLGDESESD